MKRLVALAVLLGLSSLTVADPDNPFKMGDETVRVGWFGEASYPSTLNDASAVFETVTNYDGTLLISGPYDWTFHDTYDDDDNYGYTYCQFASGGYCNTTIESGINLDTVEEDESLGVTEQSVWCHEIGHGGGAHHLGSGSGCLYDITEDHYSTHHISDHLQYP